MKTYEMQIMRSVGLVHCVISWEHEVGVQTDVSCFDTVNHGALFLFSLNDLSPSRAKLRDMFHSVAVQNGAQNVWPCRPYL